MNPAVSRTARHVVTCINPTDGRETDAELAGLLADPVVAALMLRLLLAELTDMARRDGVVASPRCRRLLELLYDAAHQGSSLVRTLGGPATGTRQVRLNHQPESGSSAGGSVPTGYVTVGVAAGRLQCSTRWVRSLARREVIKGLRAGPVWLIDEQSLESYRRGARGDRAADRRRAAS